MALYDSENNRLLDTNDNVLLARSTFTIGTQEANKVFVGNNEVKAIYIGSNLVYEKPIVLPQLATPTISLSDSILSIEEVEDAEYYDIYVDGVLEHTIDNRPVTLISFTIDETTYQAEEGMTWAEWVNSAYNTNGYIDALNEITNAGGRLVLDVGFQPVDPFDFIVSNRAYVLGSND